MNITTIKKRLPSILGFLVATLLIVYVVYSYHYLQASEADFSLNEQQYMKVIQLLNTPEYKDVIFASNNGITFEHGQPHYLLKNVQYKAEHKYLIEEISKTGDTLYLKCPKGIIKISKLSWISPIFETVYVYSPNGFNPTPENMFKKINDKFITYHNYDGTLSGSNDCDVR